MGLKCILRNVGYRDIHKKIDLFCTKFFIFFRNFFRLFWLIFGKNFFGKHGTLMHFSTDFGPGGAKSGKKGSFGRKVHRHGKKG